MTAGIGVFNKQAAVLAADSAATIGNGRKVYNTANKIFPLNSEEKIGVFIYNNSSWLGIPMELIIKLYKEKEVRVFEHLKDYINDFIIFLEKEMVKFLSEDRKDEFLQMALYEIIDFLIDETDSQLDFEINSHQILPPKSEEEKEKLFEKNLLKIINEEIEAFEDLDEQPTNNLKDIDSVKFEDIVHQKYDSIINGFISSKKLKKKKDIVKGIIKILYFKTINDFMTDDDFVGLVFAGFGLDEIFPSVYEIRFSGMLEDQVKYQIYRESAINDENSAVIAPFAQSEMASTFMEGINPEIEGAISDSIIENLHKLQEDISEKFKLEKDDLAELFSETYVKIRLEIDENKHKQMVLPVIETVSVLRKDDLVEIAESLVGITSIKRKATLDLDSVGGPVDVAIITKSEGFIWVKRKEKLNGF